MKETTIYLICAASWFPITAYSSREKAQRLVDANNKKVAIEHGYLSGIQHVKEVTLKW